MVSLHVFFETTVQQFKYMIHVDKTHWEHNQHLMPYKHKAERLVFRFIHSFDFELFKYMCFLKIYILPDIFFLGLIFTTVRIVYTLNRLTWLTIYSLLKNPTDPDYTYVIDEAKKRSFPWLERLYCPEMEMADHPLDDLEIIKVDGKIKYIPATADDQTIALILFGIISFSFVTFVFGMWGGVVYLIKNKFDIDMIFGISYLSYELEILAYLFAGYFMFLVYKFFTNTYQFMLLILLNIITIVLYLFIFFCGSGVGIILIYVIKFILLILG